MSNNELVELVQAKKEVPLRAKVPPRQARERIAPVAKLHVADHLPFFNLRLTHPLTCLARIGFQGKHEQAVGLALHRHHFASHGRHLY